MARRKGRDLNSMFDQKNVRRDDRSEEHTSELQSQFHLVCRLLLEKKKTRLNVREQVSRLPTPPSLAFVAPPQSAALTVQQLLTITRFPTRRLHQVQLQACHLPTPC